MQAFTKISLTTLITLLVASPAFASSARVDHSGFVVWAFLAVCALIVVAQLVPAVMTMLGITKTVANPK